MSAPKDIPALERMGRLNRPPEPADFQSGYAADARGVAESVRLCVATGVAGLSIEDATGEAGVPLYDLPVAIERIAASTAGSVTSSPAPGTPVAAPMENSNEPPTG